MKYFSSLATTLIVVASSVLFAGCDKNNDDFYELPNKLRGVYKVEISITGDIEGFKPYCIIKSDYDVINLNKFLYDEHGKEISNLDEHVFDYKKNSEVFSKKIICSTTNKAKGIGVLLFAGNSNILYFNEPHLVKVVFKGYFNDKLIKEQVQELDGLHPINDKDIHAHFRIGEGAEETVEE